MSDEHWGFYVVLMLAEVGGSVERRCTLASAA